MHFSLSYHERVDTTLGERSLYWRMDSTNTAVICSLQIDAHSGLLKVRRTPTRFPEIAGTVAPA